MENRQLMFMSTNSLNIRLHHVLKLEYSEKLSNVDAQPVIYDKATLDAMDRPKT